MIRGKNYITWNVKTGDSISMGWSTNPYYIGEKCVTLREECIIRNGVYLLRCEDGNEFNISSKLAQLWARWRNIEI